MFWNTRQFVVWRFEDRGPDKKPAKVTCDANGYRIDVTDRSQYMDYATAAALASSRGWGVGFCLTADDPYFLLDIDGCRDAATGEWSPVALDAMQRFAGAALEISVSGTGLHIIGRVTGDTSMLRNRWPGYEFYSQERFIALGSSLVSGWHGDPEIDMTLHIHGFVPRRPDPALSGVPLTGPVPEWSGPADDDTLIGLILNSRGSFDVLTGKHAPVGALWRGTADVLARFYPTTTEGEPFDRSSADAALVMHLGFWTGKDAERTERLWRRAPLTQGRGKLDRTDYVYNTIMTGLARVQRVYQRPADAPALPGMPAPVTGPAAPALTAPDVPAMVDPTGQATVDIASGGYLTIFDQIAHFKGCILIDEDKAVLCPDGELRDRARFDAWYGGHEFQMTPDGSKPTKYPWEAFTMSRVHKFPRVLRRRYIPGVPFGAFVSEGTEINMFRYVPPKRRYGDVTPFLDLLQRMVPDARDRAIILSWCAALVQNVGKKFQWALALQGCEGNGKSLFLRFVSEAIGIDVTHLPNPEDMNEKYNTYVEGNLLIGVEEIHMDGRRDVLDRLKKYITNDRVEVRGMQKDKRMTDNLTNWIFLTNHRDAIAKSRGDRRYAIFYTAQQEVEDLERDGMIGDYFPRLWDWARDGGFEIVTDYLNSVEIPDEFNPAKGCHRAPETSSTAAAIRESAGLYEQIVMECVEQELPGFRGGWISTVRVREEIEKRRKTIGPSLIKSVLRNLKYRPCETWVEGKAPSPIFQEGNMRPRLYVNDSVPDDQKTFVYYIHAQGYTLPGMQ